MRTKRWAGLLALVLLLSLCGGALATAARVYDGADLFTASEEAALEEEIARFQEETGMDFVVVTSDEPQEDGEPVSYTHLDVYKRQDAICSDTPVSMRFPPFG